MFTKSDADMLFNCLSSQDAARQFLQQNYCKQELPDAESKAYSNAQTFLYYITYGESLFTQGHTLPKSTQPLLYFYGAAHLIKACLLTVCSDYPEQTSQLAHGVSARKRKKRDFSFIADEVKIQQQGLFPCFSNNLFSINHFPETKIKMLDLLSGIPEMLPIISDSSSAKLAQIGSTSGKQLQIPDKIRDGYQLTWNTFIQRIMPLLPHSPDITENKKSLQLDFANSIGALHGPIFTTNLDGSIYVHLEKNPVASMSELMIHYLLLYNLSMLSRYETEWWGDLFALKETIDYPAIAVFLDITANKFPSLIAAWLNEQKRKNPGSIRHRD